jgi:hypothetical protein
MVKIEDSDPDDIVEVTKKPGLQITIYLWVPMMTVDSDTSTLRVTFGGWDSSLTLSRLKKVPNFHL